MINGGDDRYAAREAGQIMSDDLSMILESPTTEEGVPDGMKVDVEGRIFCTGPGGARVFDPSGRHLGTIRLPEIPANCAFGAPDRRTLFFTARTSLYAVRVKVPGITAL
jgi:sugar lactone lactonase YvrE